NFSSNKAPFSKNSLSLSAPILKDLNAHQPMSDLTESNFSKESQIPSSAIIPTDGEHETRSRTKSNKTNKIRGKSQLIIISRVGICQTHLIWLEVWTWRVWRWIYLILLQKGACLQVSEVVCTLQAVDEQFPGDGART